jgi:xanthine dehydrogenase YagR molybdenum-binding subunit
MDDKINIPADRVDGKDKVTGAAKYTAEYPLPGLQYAVFAPGIITRGNIISINTKAAENAPGVTAVITHLNAPAIPGWAPNPDPSKGEHANRPLQLFYDAHIYYNGQPIALVIADTFERATYAASLVKATYREELYETDLEKNIDKGKRPGNRADYVRGEADAWKDAVFKLEAEYTMPTEVHNPMELHAIIADWTADDKVTVYDKTQGVKDTQRNIMRAFKLPESNVTVIAEFVGGGFGSALRTWPHEIMAVSAAKKINKPVKLVLTRADMFTSVGYRPRTIQKIGIGATAEGKLTGITHEAIGQTSSYENFTEGVLNMTQFLYACPNVNTSYKIVSLDVGTPTWMRGPGEATGSFALESAIDELAYALAMDSLDLRKKNYAETDPERNRPFSSKYLNECYDIGAEKIGWYKRNRQPRSMQEDGMLVGYGMSTGVFGAYRGRASVRVVLNADGSLLLESAVSDSGPGTATAMTQIASSSMGIPISKIRFNLGESNLPPGPTQGGSTTTATLGSAVYDVCEALKEKLLQLSSNIFGTVKKEDIIFGNQEMKLASDNATRASYGDILKQNNLPQVELVKDSSGAPGGDKYSMYSFSVHFTKVHVNPVTGVVKVKQVVTVGDAGKIVSEKTARSQMIGGVVGGIGMALMEESVIDHRYGRYVNNNFADYHVPVNADVPHIEAYFVNKPDPIINPMGAKGMGEIALIGFAASITNAVYHATGKRIRELPVTPDKLLLPSANVALTRKEAFDPKKITKIEIRGGKWKSQNQELNFEAHPKISISNHLDIEQICSAIRSAKIERQTDITFKYFLNLTFEEGTTSLMLVETIQGEFMFFYEHEHVWYNGKSLAEILNRHLSKLPAIKN